MRKRLEEPVIQTSGLTLYFKCPYSDCELFHDKIEWNPDNFSEAGMPICSECGTDLCYYGFLVVNNKG